MKREKNILILCTGNSCRSQMAHGYLEHLTQSEGINIYSAGVETHGVNPFAIKVMKEDGIDISHHTSNHIDEYRTILFDYIITVCDHAKERCPFFPSNAKRIHINFPDPAKATGNEKTIVHEFQIVRNMIKSFCTDFVNEELK